MKILLTILMASAGVCLAGGEAAAPKKQLFHADQLELTAYGTVLLEDINGDTEFGIGWGADYFVTRNMGIGGRIEQSNLSDEWVDRAIGRLTFRAPLWDRLSPYGYAQGIWGVEDNDWGAGAGAGLELRLAEHFSTFGEGGLDVTTEGRGGMQFSAGIRFDF